METHPMLSSWLRSWKTRSQRTLAVRNGPATRGKRFRPVLEALEDRALPSSYTAASVSDLIADISLANQAGGASTITLVPSTTFTLTAVNNSTYGATGLPVIAAGTNLTISGNGDMIGASTASGTPAFRLLAVANGASLTLSNLTLTNGIADGSGMAAQGGGVYNLGTLTLSGVTVVDNNATGPSPAGGGIYNAGGSVTMTNGTILNTNWAWAGAGGNAYGANIYNDKGTLTLQAGTVVEYGQCRAGNGTKNGGSGFGGGIYSSGGSVTIQGSSITNNFILAGIAGIGKVTAGSAYGGGIYVAGGTVSLSDSVVTGNQALGDVSSSKGGTPGNGYGGGVYVAGGMVSLSGDTINSNTASCSAQSSGPLGSGFGGGVYVAGGTVTLSGDIVQSNTAAGRGGGLYIASAATVYLDAFTLANCTGNSPDNIVGSYVLL
jgi:hypothetical protein